MNIIFKNMLWTTDSYKEFSKIIIFYKVCLESAIMIIQFLKEQETEMAHLTEE